MLRDTLPLNQVNVDRYRGLCGLLRHTLTLDSMDASNAIIPVSVQCPYCGESFDTSVDLSAGAQCYTEDCHVCCQPIECSVSIDVAGELNAFSVRRENE